MAGGRLSVVRYGEIQRRLKEGRSVREIALALRCSRKTVRGIKTGEIVPPDKPSVLENPLWTAQVDWPAVIGDLGLGHPLKFIWGEKAQGLTTYSNFWKQFYRKHPQYRTASVTLREFAPGERAEVDYAGDTVEWADLKTGEIHDAPVFVGVLGFSQLLFAWAADDMKSRNWLAAHRRMFEAFGGVPHVTVPDCLKTGVLKCHLYDPDLNPAYSEMAAHYGTAVVPARPKHPKDKALVEGAVRIVMRYFRFKHRHHTFTSLGEINHALTLCVEQINARPHTRFRVSRAERFEKLERAALKKLPAAAFEAAERKTAKLHADCYLAVESAYYSAPHIHRGKTLRVKLTENLVEIYLGMERLAVHPRDRHRCGNRIRIESHFPENSKAYYEATPQKLLSQARFVNLELHALVVGLFNDDVYGNIRRVQGLLRVCAKEIEQTSLEVATPRIEKAIAKMRRFNKIRVAYFQECLKYERLQCLPPDAAREIVRLPGNPLLRYGQIAPGDATAPPITQQETLNL